MSMALLYGGWSYSARWVRKRVVSKRVVLADVPGSKTGTRVHSPKPPLLRNRPFVSCRATLVAFHPRPQIASDLGRNITRSFNPHRNRNQFPSGNEILVYGRRFKSQPASTRCDLRIASPTSPFLQVIWTPQIANPQAAIAELGPPGGRKSQNRRPQGH